MRITSKLSPTQPDYLKGLREHHGVLLGSSFLAAGGRVLAPRK
jgi:hypothetical protein